LISFTAKTGTLHWDQEPRIFHAMQPCVHLMLGLPGAGKTTLSVKLSEELSLPRFSLDEEYFSVVPNHQQCERDFVIEAQVEERIKERVTALLASGTSVILDFCPWRVAQRWGYYSFIESHGALPQVHYLPVGRDELLRRLEIRNSIRDERYQYMSPEMLDEFCGRFDPPTDEELKYIVTLSYP
jgi:adenylate kinase family enzyme